MQSDIQLMYTVHTLQHFVHSFIVLTYTDVYLAFNGSFVEWRVVPVVPGVGVGPLAQQQGHNLKTTHRTSGFNRCAASKEKH